MMMSLHGYVRGVRASRCVRTPPCGERISTSRSVRSTIRYLRSSGAPPLSMAATAMARHHTRLSALLVQLSPVATDESLTLQLDSSLGELLQSTLVPSFVGAVVVCGEEVYRFTHGEATGATLFHMASVSKTFVAVAVMQLVQEGLLALDDAVLKYLPWWSINGERADEITVRQLLTHTAGMPDVVDYGWSRPEYDDDALERWLRGEVAERSLLWAPGSRGQSPSEGVRGSDGWAYSNIAFELLAALVAELRGVSFERAVAQQVCQLRNYLSCQSAHSRRSLQTRIDTGTAGIRRQHILALRGPSQPAFAGLYQATTQGWRSGDTSGTLPVQPQTCW